MKTKCFKKLGFATGLTGATASSLGCMVVMFYGIGQEATVSFLIVTSRIRYNFCRAYDVPLWKWDWNLFSFYFGLANWCLIASFYKLGQLKKRLRWEIMISTHTTFSICDKAAKFGYSKWAGTFKLPKSIFFVILIHLLNWGKTR